MKLQFTQQDYQEECVEYIKSIVYKLKQGKNITDIMKEHASEKGYKQQFSDRKKLDILMETGTGKTFTYIQTIFELNKHYKQNKFIIFVPSIAIREGVIKNIEITEDYFKVMFQCRINLYSYEGANNINSLYSFINTDVLSVLILTPQAITSKAQNKIHQKTHEIFLGDNSIENGKALTPMEHLARICDTIIIDEPHKFKGGAFREIFDEYLKDKLLIRFGATYPKAEKDDFDKNFIELSNIAYTLNSLDAFYKNLVKSITVYSVGTQIKRDKLIETKNKDTAMVSCYENGIVKIKTLKVGDKYNEHTIRQINKSSILLSDSSEIKVQKTKTSKSTQTNEVQPLNNNPSYELSDIDTEEIIKLTIKKHFEKEQELYSKGIKAISLFFINRVADYRGDNAKVKIIFEAEYKKQRAEKLKSLKNTTKDNEYKKYLEQDFDNEGQLKVGAGYFASDNGKTNDDKIKEGIDLILREKEKLLSFDTPQRFIFSVWALQEGWDNPNVSTICKLSPIGNSDTSALQQVGRGLRLCVNQNGTRQTFELLNKNNDQFTKLNSLDVIISAEESYFIESIQQEVKENSNYFITFIQNTEEFKSKMGIDNDRIARKTFDLLENINIIKYDAQQDIYVIQEDAITKIQENRNDIIKTLNNDESKYKQLLVLMNSPELNDKIRDGNNIKPKEDLIITKKKYDDFQEIWRVINSESKFQIEHIDENEQSKLIKNITTRINDIKLEKSYQQISKDKLTTIDNKNIIIDRGTEQHESEAIVIPTNYLTLTHEIAKQTKIPLAMSAEIIKGLDKDKIGIKYNPQQFKAEAIEIIKNEIIKQIECRVSYNVNTITTKSNSSDNSEMLLHKDQYENSDTIIIPAGSTGSIQEKIKDIENEFPLKNKWLYENVIEYDASKAEKKLILTNDNSSITIFAKLPKINIKTPIGLYNPDFAYVIKKNKDKDNEKILFLIVEVKGYQTEADIPKEEKMKMNYATKFFNKLKEVNTNINIEYKPYINNSDLNNIISEIMQSKA